MESHSEGSVNLISGNRSFAWHEDLRDTRTCATRGLARHDYLHDMVIYATRGFRDTRICSTWGFAQEGGGAIGVPSARALPHQRCVCRCSVLTGEEFASGSLVPRGPRGVTVSTLESEPSNRLLTPVEVLLPA